MKVSHKSIRVASPKLPSPMRFPTRKIAEEDYLASLLDRWPNARAIEHDGAFIIVTPEGFCLSELDLMQKLFPRGVCR